MNKREKGKEKREKCYRVVGRLLTTRIHLVLIFSFLFFHFYFAHAQTVSIEWTGGDNAIRYEVTIEKEEDHEFISYLEETTTEKHLILSLPPGNYSYRIIPYDILDRPGNATQWIYFEVPPPPQPEPEKERKPRNFVINITAAFMPEIPVYGAVKQDTELIGANLRASINLPLKEDTFFGPEISGTWRDGVVTAGLSARFLKTAGNYFGFVYRAGAEYIIRLDNRQLDDPFLLTTGFSFILQVTKMVNIEAGVDFTSTINFLSYGNIRPFIGLGVRF